MADNVNITAGAGTTIATDQVGTDHYQKVKLADGTADSSTVIAAGGGVEANALRVTIASDCTGVVTVDGTVTAELSATDNAVLDVIAAKDFATQTTLAALNAKLVTGTVIGDVNLGATDNAVLDAIASSDASIDGKITACNTGAVVIASGAITETNSASLAVVGGGTEATALRVTLANDSTGVITVDGTITANLSDTDNAVLDTVDAALDAINAKLVTGTVIGDVNLGATDNAVLDSIVTNTNRAAITGYGQAKLDHADVTTAQVLVAAVADKKFYITSITLSVAAAGSYWIEDDDAAQITCKFTLAANGGLVWTAPVDTPWKSTTANKGLKVKGSAAGVVGCMITYYTLA